MEYFFIPCFFYTFAKEIINNRIMIELKGKYGKDCKVFNNDIEEEAISTIYKILNTKEFENSKVRIMPDCLPINSEILTENGFKFIKDLNEDDKVANFNKETKKISFHKPINIIKIGRAHV